MKKKLLLHVCCAPCSASAILILKDEFEISYFWHNPNIYPRQEYDKRKESAQMFAKANGFAFYELKDFEYDYDKWISDGGEVCKNCYLIRLEQTAAFAKTNGFECFSTSLLSSPYQKHDMIKVAAKEFSDKYGVEFLYKDFRTAFYEGKTLARNAGSYMQKYCACKKSLNERLQEDKKSGKIPAIKAQ